jgi:hypothetical protein
MTTDDLREKYGKAVSIYCWSSEDYVFNDEYVLWLEEQILK